MLGLIVWGNFFALLVMLPVAALTDGVEVMRDSLINLNMRTILSLLYIAYASTFFCYTVWCSMLAHHPAAEVVPFTLLVPAFAMISASLFLGEPYPLWKFGATVLILSGLALNQFGGAATAWIGRLFKPEPVDN